MRLKKGGDVTIYVDQLFTATPRTAQARKFGTRWSHNFQDHVQHYLKHYDLTPNKRRLAVARGAIEVDMVEHIRAMMGRTA